MGGGDDAFDEGIEAEAEAEPAMTMDELIEEYEARELEADLVLGGDEGKECTYPHGYMKRQAIFSCLTCVPSGDAGVCTACSLSCHDGHEVVELWTKRKFRCDCGNSKFGVFFCKLCPGKDPENIENSYNQNFKGSYCTCGRPYPDPEAEDEVEMIQCCICEDWFHEDHIGLDSSEEIPKDEEGEPMFDEFICQDCAPTFAFLQLYPADVWSTPRHKDPVVSSKGETALENVLFNSTNSQAMANGFAYLSNPDSTTVPGIESSSKDSSSAISPMKKCTIAFPSNGYYACKPVTDSESRCNLGLNINTKEIAFDKKKPMFLSREWRLFICACTTCVEYYAKKGISYLIDKEDSVGEYEKIAKRKREEKLQKEENVEFNFLDNLKHVQKIEFLNGLSVMKNELKSFLESFNSSSKTVTSDDIKDFFENLSKKKKSRLE